MDDPPMARPLRQRGALWVVSTHAWTSLLATLLLLFMGACVLTGVWRIVNPAQLFLLFAWFGLTGILAALNSANDLRSKVAYPQPEALVTQCTLWYAAVILTGLLAIAFRQHKWSTQLMFLLPAIPTVAGFWWQTRSQFRKWEQEQQPPKSYGFPVTLLNQSSPAPPAVLPIADVSPMQWVEQVQVGGQTWHLKVEQNPNAGKFAVQCRELPAAIEQGSTAAQAIANGKDAIASVLDYMKKSGRTPAR